MRSALIAFAAAGAVGCATAQHARPTTAPARVGADQAFSCAMRVATERGFTVLDADRGSGFANFERQAPADLLSTLGSFTMLDRLAVTIVAPTGGDSVATIRIVGAQIQIGGGGRPPNSRQTLGPSGATERDGFAILRSCGVLSDSILALFPDSVARP